MGFNNARHLQFEIREPAEPFIWHFSWLSPKALYGFENLDKLLFCFFLPISLFT